MGYQKNRLRTRTCAHCGKFEMTIEQQHRFALEFLEKIPMNKFDSIIDIGAGEGLQSAWFQSVVDSMVKH